MAAMAVAACGGSPPRDPARWIPPASEACGGGGAMSTRALLDLESPTHVLREGAMLAVPGALVLTGMEVDATRDLEEQDAIALPVVANARAGRLPPFRLETGPRVTALRPVAAEGGSWGVIWGEAVPPDGHDGSWHSQWVTSLKYAEWSGAGWAPANNIRLLSRICG
jgi:hypothetical protein